ncbi:MAG: hypothetical protein J2P22_00500 [Nocardioides sp.]|nr:hypothetical protein [Nocardioides sp.]
MTVVAAPAADAAGQTTVNFTSPGVTTWTAPAGVTAVQITAVGGRGGDCFNGAGGRGDTVTAIVPVAANFQYRVQVAGAGAGGGFCAGTGTAGGVGGGGTGGAGKPGVGASGGGGGGGASMFSTGAGAPTSASVLLVAGGGGGGTYDVAGGDAGKDGSNGGGGQGTAGTQSGPGLGGAAQGGSNATSGSDGSAFLGGNAGTGGSGTTDFGAGGGGGGGGYFGGGGGGGGAAGSGGSGGGGSSYVKSTAYVVSAPAPTASAGMVSITYPAAAPPSASISAPVDGGTYVVGQTVHTSFACTEGVGGSGLTSCDDSNGTTTATGGSGTLDTSVGGFHTYTVTAMSSSGLSDTTSISYTVMYPPTANISSPATGGIYKLGQTVPTTFSCTEGLGGPGLVACNDSTGSFTVDGGTGQLDTSTAGSHTYKVTGTSDDGYKGTASISYQVTSAHIAIKTGTAVVASGKTKVTVACSGAMVCTGKIKLVASKKVVAANAYTTTGGSTKTVTLHVTAAGMTMLHKAKTHSISTNATATVAGGPTAKRTIVLKLK